MPLFEVEQHASGKRNRQAIFIVEQVAIASCLSLEIEAVGAFAPDRLPDNMFDPTV